MDYRAYPVYSSVLQCIILRYIKVYLLLGSTQSGACVPAELIAVALA